MSKRGLLSRALQKKYLPEFVYGSIDGTITTFAIVSGSIGASFSSSIILILGFANLIADGFSMAVSSYLSAKSQKDLASPSKHKHRHYENRKPSRIAIATFVSFILIGLIPLLSFILAMFFPIVDTHKYILSYTLTGLALILIGAVKGKLTSKSSLYSAMQTLLIGGIAAALAFGAGYGLSHLIR